jgi:hypothetical protein
LWGFSLSIDVPMCPTPAMHVKLGRMSRLEF